MAAASAVPTTSSIPVHREKNRGLMAILISPSVFLLVLLNGYPVAYAIFQAVHNGDLLDTGSFVGLDNFSTVLTSWSFWKAARFTAIFTFVGVFGSWLVGLGLALLLQREIPGKAYFKVALLLPWVVPTVVSAMAWNRLVATPDSLIPHLVNTLGFETPRFLADPVLAGVVVCVFKVWISFPFMMMMASSALTAVDRSLYEAASMDGATSWQSFRRITLPMIAPSTFISWILMSIFCVNDFSTIYLLTGGGPVDATTSLVVLSYTTAFANFQIGPGVAVAIMMTIALTCISLILFHQIKKSSLR